MERTHTTHGELLIHARLGDRQAWSELVYLMSPIVWSIIRSFRLDHGTAKDVAQTVWAKPVENCDRISDPDWLPGWISTTCRREAMATVKGLRRTIPSEFEYDIEDTDACLDSKSPMEKTSRNCG